MMSKHMLRMMVLGFGFSAVAALSNTADAQRVVDLQQGVRIRVETRNHGEFVGTLESATVDTIRLRDSFQTLAFSTADTKSVSTSPGQSAVRGMLRTGVASGILGAIAGAGIGALTFKPCKSGGVFDCAYVPDTRSQTATFAATSFGVTSLVIGGIVGAIRGSDNWTPVALH